MIQAGLVDEVQRLYEQYGQLLTNIGAIGYKEIIRYLNGACTLEKAIDDVKKATRHLAKRQMTWFRGMERRGFSIFWLDAALSLDEKIAKIDEKITQSV